jgi:hypothetical protein
MIDNKLQSSNQASALNHEKMAEKKTFKKDMDSSSSTAIRAFDG